jgi:hypothetical protein
MRLDVANNGSYSIEGVASQLSPVPLAFRADLQVAHPKKFGLAQMPAVKRSRAGICASALTTDEPRICVGRTAIKSPISEDANALLSLHRLIFDQAFCHGWSLAGCRLEFLAARIVVGNKEVLNFAY